MTAGIKYILRLSLIFCGNLLPMVLQAGGPGPPPPPDPTGAPIDMVAGVMLVGAALFAAKRIYFTREAA